jgi:hypothetical protein
MQKKSNETRKPVRTQREVLCDVMLSAAQCETWLTLQELALLTHYGEASISAQLRHLRKPQYGAFVVEKRHREVDAVVRREIGIVWEYKLRRSVRRRVVSVPVPRLGKKEMALLPAAC